jgi:hypothetical protein
VLLRIVARLAAVKGVLFGRQVQVQISIPTFGLRYVHTTALFCVLRTTYYVFRLRFIYVIFTSFLTYVKNFVVCSHCTLHLRIKFVFNVNSNFHFLLIDVVFVNLCTFHVRVQVQSSE